MHRTWWIRGLYGNLWIGYQWNVQRRMLKRQLWWLSVQVFRILWTILYTIMQHKCWWWLHSWLWYKLRERVRSRFWLCLCDSYWNRWNWNKILVRRDYLAKSPLTYTLWKCLCPRKLAFDHRRGFYLYWWPHYRWYCWMWPLNGKYLNFDKKYLGSKRGIDRRNRRITYWKLCLVLFLLRWLQYLWTKWDLFCVSRQLLSAFPLEQTWFYHQSWETFILWC